MPSRTCAGCATEDRSDDLVRVVLAEDGSVAVDLAGRAFGRGAWVHPRRDCIAKAAQRGLARSFRAEVRTSADALWRAMGDASSRRMRGLIASASKSQLLRAGTDAVAEAVRTGGAKLVIVAEDARASATTPAVLAAERERNVVVWGTKADLGVASGRGDTGVVAVLDDGLAAALRRAAALRDGATASARSEGA